MSTSGTADTNQAEKVKPFSLLSDEGQSTSVGEVSQYPEAADQPTTRPSVRGASRRQQVAGKMGHTSTVPRRTLMLDDDEEKDPSDPSTARRTSPRKGSTEYGSPRASISSLDLGGTTSRSRKTKPGLQEQDEAPTSRSKAKKKSGGQARGRGSKAAAGKSSSTSSTEEGAKSRARAGTTAPDTGGPALPSPDDELKETSAVRSGRSKIHDSFVIQECVDIWTHAPEDRILPREAGSPNLGPRQVIERSSDVLDKFHEPGSWLKLFDLISTTNPLSPQMVLYVIALEDMSGIEMLSLLQSALFEAGYSFMNLVPAALRQAPELAGLDLLEVMSKVRSARYLISMEVREWIRFRSIRPEQRSPTVSSRSPVDVYAMRKPESILSSSDGIPGQQSSLRTSQFSFLAPQARSRATTELGQHPSDPPMSQSLAFGTVRPEAQPQRLVDPSHYRFQQPSVVPAVSAPLAFRAHRQQPVQVQPVPAFMDSSHQAPGVSFQVNPAPAFHADASVYLGSGAGDRAGELASGRPTPRRADTQAASAPISVPSSAHAEVWSAGRRANDAGGRGAVHATSERSAIERGSAPASVVAPPSQPSQSVPRPFVPNRYLDKFTGLESLADRKLWYKEYVYLAESGYWTDAERCRNIELYLRGPAEAWLQQLGAARRVWTSLSAAFQTEFCVSRGSPFEKYFGLTQRKDETPLQHLWRLNAAAVKARIPLTSSIDLKNHLDRFIKSLSSESARNAFRGRSYDSLAQLEDAARDLDRDVDRDDYRRSSRYQDRDRERERSIARSASVYYAYEGDDNDEDADWGLADDRRVRFDGDEPGDCHTESVYQASGRVQSQQQGRWRPGSQSPGRHAGAPGSNGRPRPGLSVQSPRGPNCFNCDEPGHWANDCPQKGFCSLCEAPGHRSESCPKRCSFCDEVHAPGECELKKALKSLLRSETTTNAASAGQVQPLN